MVQAKCTRSVPNYDMLQLQALCAWLFYSLT